MKIRERVKSGMFRKEGLKCVGDSPVRTPSFPERGLTRNLTGRYQ
jgi:hypothetical protein